MRWPRRTARSDKHPAYEILNGPSGAGINDLFTPEINSVADAAGHDWTQVNSLTQQNDHRKTQAVLNEIKGFDHSGRHRVGTPAVFGLNFQSVSTAEKLPASDGSAGGFDATGTVPGPVLANSLGFVDHQIAEMIAGLRRADIFHDTALILSAKHGQSPTDGRALKRIDDGAVIDALNTGSQVQHADQPQPLVAASLNDDGMLWFSNEDRTALADAFASRLPRVYDGDGIGSDGRATATDIAQHRCPTRLVHVVEYLWKGTWSLHPEADPAAERWVRRKALAILDGDALKVARAIRRQATNANLNPTHRKSADEAADYLTNKART